MAGLKMTLDGEFTDDSLDRDYPNDPMINQGTMFLIDFGKAISFPEQNNPEDGDTVNNIAPSGGVGTVFGSAITFDDNAFLFPGSPSNNHVTLGALGNMSAVSKFIIQIWVKQETATYSSTADQVLIGRGADLTTNLQWVIEMGAGGRIPRAGVASSTESNLVSAPSDNPLDVPVLITLGYDNGVTSIGRNGVIIATHGVVVEPPLNNPGVNTLIGSSFQYFKGHIYRAIGENLTLSGKTVARQCKREYDLNVARFV